MDGINFELIKETGTEIIADAPTVYPQPLALKVHGYDNGGIWVEGEKLNEMAHDTMKDKAEAEGSALIFFLPYAAIRFALISVPRDSSFLKEEPIRVLS